MRLRNKLGAIYLGQYIGAFEYHVNMVCIMVGIWELPQISAYSRRYWLNFGMAWSWVPQIIWAQEDWYDGRIPQHRPGVRSSSWTGRSLAVRSWEWPRKMSWSIARG
jgi:hypothetical protein